MAFFPREFTIPASSNYEAVVGKVGAWNVIKEFALLYIYIQRGIKPT
jgi:hypothetical protein